MTHEDMLKALEKESVNEDLNLIKKVKDEQAAIIDQYREGLVSTMEAYTKLMITLSELPLHTKLAEETFKPFREFELEICPALDRLIEKIK